MSLQALLAEFLGAFVLLLFGGLSILAGGGDLIVIGFGFGFALLAALYAFGEFLDGTATRSEPRGVPRQTYR